MWSNFRNNFLYCLGQLYNSSNWVENSLCICHDFIYVLKNPSKIFIPVLLINFFMNILTITSYQLSRKIALLHLSVNINIFKIILLLYSMQLSLLLLRLKTKIIETFSDSQLFCKNCYIEKRENWWFYGEIICKHAQAYRFESGDDFKS